MRIKGCNLLSKVYVSFLNVESVKWSANWPSTPTINMIVNSAGFYSFCFVNCLNGIATYIFVIKFCSR